MSTDLRIYESIEGHDLAVTAFATAADAPGEGRRGVQFTVLEERAPVALDEIAVRRLRTRLAMFLNAAPQETEQTLPYAYDRDDVHFRAQFLVAMGQVVLEIDDVQLILTIDQAEDLHNVLDERLTVDAYDDVDVLPRRVDVDGEWVQEEAAGG